MNEDIQKTFQEAVRNNDVETARRMIAAGADVNASYQVVYKDNSTYTEYPIFQCLDDTRLEMLAFLLEVGADVNVQNKYGDSPLGESVSYYEPQCVKKLIENGANLNIRDEEGVTPIFFAIIGRQPDILRILIENGAAVNVVATMPRESALSMARTKASYYGDKELYECVSILEEAGTLDELILDIVDFPSLGKEDFEFLFAVQYQNMDGVKKALQAGANVNCLGRYETSAIDQAAFYANKELCQFLVEAGTKSEFIEKACHECCYLESDAETLEYLLQQLDKVAVDRVCNELLKKCEHRKLCEIMERQMTNSISQMKRE